MGLFVSYFLIYFLFRCLNKIGPSKDSNNDIPRTRNGLFFKVLNWIDSLDKYRFVRSLKLIHQIDSIYKILLNKEGALCTIFLIYRKFGMEM
jgi:hypothetical protein